MINWNKSKSMTAATTYELPLLAVLRLDLLPLPLLLLQKRKTPKSVKNFLLLRAMNETPLWSPFCFLRCSLFFSLLRLFWKIGVAVSRGDISSRGNSGDRDSGVGKVQNKGERHWLLLPRYTPRIPFFTAQPILGARFCVRFVCTPPDNRTDLCWAVHCISFGASATDRCCRFEYKTATFMVIGNVCSRPMLMRTKTKVKSVHREMQSSRECLHHKNGHKNLQMKHNLIAAYYGKRVN